MGAEMDMDFEKTLAILNGESVEDIEVAQLTELDRLQVSNAVDLIFQGLSLQNWLGGGVLRDAWQNALDQLRDMVFSIEVINPVTLYARNVTFEMRTMWTEKMRTAPHTNMAIQCNDAQRADWADSAKFKIQTGTNLLMKKINDFNAGTSNTVKNTVSGHVPTFQQMFDSRMEQENQRVREREM